MKQFFSKNHLLNKWDRSFQNRHIPGILKIFNITNRNAKQRSWLKGISIANYRININLRNIKYLVVINLWRDVSQVVGTERYCPPYPGSTRTYMQGARLTSDVCLCWLYHMFDYLDCCQHDAIFVKNFNIQIVNNVNI